MKGQQTEEELYAYKYMFKCCMHCRGAFRHSLITVDRDATEGLSLFVVPCSISFPNPNRLGTKGSNVRGGREGPSYNA